VQLRRADRLPAGSPWPKFRADAAQDGVGVVHPRATNQPIWSFQTGKGIFSSPVVSADGTIYVGSADRTFYALHPDGTLRWKLLTGEIIDSAALLDDCGRVYFGSGDAERRTPNPPAGIGVAVIGVGVGRLERLFGGQGRCSAPAP
jgi:hypothetical protein